MLMRIERAYTILEQNSHAPMILEDYAEEKLFNVRSSADSSIFYAVDTEIMTCTCPDFNFRSVKCKHLLAAEFASAAHG
jgi:hypothetical protein